MICESRFDNKGNPKPVNFSLMNSKFKDKVRHLIIEEQFPNLSNGWFAESYQREKIFDAMMAGSIPIYYGPPNIREYIPDDAYIAMQNFTNFSDLYSFCMSMTKAEKSKYRESIKSFLQKGIGPFTAESFNNSLHKILSNE